MSEVTIKYDNQSKFMYWYLEKIGIRKFRIHVGSASYGKALFLLVRPEAAKRKDDLHRVYLVRGRSIDNAGMYRQVPLAS
ncbi:hypothetical protein NC651_020360 [Populus alba x Populus x berolinensis]|nr:hypothetical protein NC651_020360 [Populus alba x Populus x berolinensis]